MATDFILLQDLSGSFSDDLPILQGLVEPLIEELRDSDPDSLFAVGSFIDKPRSPFGDTGDFVYQTNLPLTASTDAAADVINGLVTVSGADAPEAQLEALLQVALRGDEIGYREGSNRFVILSTDAPFHVAGDGAFGAPPILLPNNGDAIIDPEEDYPSIEQVAAALKESSITPIFLVAPEVIGTYTDLAAALGGSVFPLASDSSSIVDGTREGLLAISGVITIFGTPGDDTLAGTEGFDGIVGTLGIDIIFGLDGRDLLDGGADDDDIRGGRGGDDLEGGTGDDTVVGGAGGDLIEGSLGDDTLRGGSGRDRLDSGDGGDLMVGGKGSDRFIGGDDGDTMRGLAGGDTMRGLGGDDVIGGGRGNDRLVGGSGDDDLKGGRGNDTLRGGGGQDRLNGGVGSDLIFGGGGSDLFVLAEGEGLDTIEDFRVGKDLIQVKGGVGFDALSFDQLSQGTLISLDGDDLALLSGVNVDQLTESSFA